MRWIERAALDIMVFGLCSTPTCGGTILPQPVYSSKDVDYGLIIDQALGLEVL